MKKPAAIAALTALVAALTLGVTGPAEARKDTGWPCGGGCRIAR